LAAERNDAADYFVVVGKDICDFDFHTKEKEFLLDKALIEYINNVIGEIKQFSQLVYDKTGALELEHSFLDSDEDILAKKVYFEKKEIEVQEKFKSVLDFRKI